MLRLRRLVRPKIDGAWLLFCGILFLAVIRTAWVCDDAFISARVVDNFLSGHGLRWNVTERVQAATHPLWLFCMAGARVLFRDAYVSVILLGLGTTLLTAWVIAKSSTRPGAFVALVAGTLALSKSFVDFSTSGLENPLSHLLVALLWRESVSKSQPSYFKCCLFAALALLNRLDLALVVLPTLLLHASRYRRRAGSLIGTTFSAFSPLIGWLAFSLVYYGFLLPNTAYAKLGLGIPRGQLLLYGLRYFLQPIWNDPLTLVLLFTGLPLGLLRGSREIRALTGGALLYLGYIVWIGGDFMAGRFLSTPVLVSVLALMELRPKPSTALQSGLAVGAVFLQSFTPLPVWGRPLPHTKQSRPQGHGETCMLGVCDERYYYASHTALVHDGYAPVRPWHPWSQAGLEWAKHPGVVRDIGAIGFRGFAAGPKVFIIDRYALSDPLLARMPAETNPYREWKPGHVKRCIPPGYRQAVKVGPQGLKSRKLAAYYAKIWLVTRGALWSKKRWKAIWDLNTTERVAPIDKGCLKAD
jgi:arabinofuranosyltransferase